MQLRVGDAAFGRYAALLNLAYMFGVMLDFGIANYATARISGSPEEAGRAFGPLLRARLGLCVAYAAVVSAAAVILGFRGPDLALLAGILAVQALAQTTLFVRACVAALQRFRTDALLSVADRLLMLLLCGTLLLSGVRFGTGTFVGLQAVGYSGALALAWIALRRAAPGPLLQGGGRTIAWASLRRSAPYALLIFLMAVYTRADLLLVERLGPGFVEGSPVFRTPAEEEAGFYAAAYRLLDMGNMAGLTVVSVLLPLFGRLLSEKASVGPVVRAGMALLLPFSFFAAAVCVCYGDKIAVWLYPETAERVAPVLSALMLAFPAFCLSNVYSTLLTAAGKLRALIAIAAAAAVVNLVANGIFIPFAGAGAAAWVAVTTQWIAATSYAVGAIWLLNLRADVQWISRHLGLGLGIAAVAWGLQHFTPTLDWRAGTVALAAAAAVLFMGLRLATPGQLVQIFRKS